MSNPDLDIDEELIEDILWKLENDEAEDLETHEIIGAVGRLSSEAALNLADGKLDAAAYRFEDIAAICEHWCTIQEDNNE